MCKVEQTAPKGTARLEVLQIALAKRAASNDGKTKMCEGQFIESHIVAQCRQTRHGCKILMWICVQDQRIKHNKLFMSTNTIWHYVSHHFLRYYCIFLSYYIYFLRY